MLRGVRFAPSPTGAFHVGNFRTAWVSWWWARRLGEPWVVRFEDIDAPRVVAGARERQSAELASLGLVADETLVQSRRHGRHWDTFARAAFEGAVYPCFCSRKEVKEALASAASAPHGEPPVYAGRCRGLDEVPGGRKLEAIAWRFRGRDPSGTGDFIVARTAPPREPGDVGRLKGSFVPAYHWACAVDDADGRYRLLVRAVDLASAAGHQRDIARLVLGWEGFKGAALEGALAAVFHCALVVGPGGSRLEKRTRAVTLPELEKAGIAPARLVAAFEQSFDAGGAERELARLTAPGALGGEAMTELSLARLLPGWGGA